ncbi:hypothetical protein E2C01_070043 [Portunus trituberculatus]|uniref:Uncharacterized protein n=1 Tax=Portunus trituberculatus TaxID=210409 RepID=A0A5B7HT66_PORTR|nr:hypothetical protein [Portunus trituberculatus]
MCAARNSTRRTERFPNLVRCLLHLFGLHPNYTPSYGNLFPRPEHTSMPPGSRIPLPSSSPSVSPQHVQVERGV